MTAGRRRVPAGPLGKLLALVASVVLLLAGLMFSVVILAVAAVAGLAAWSYFWWKTRKLRKDMREHPPGGVVIDGEAVVVEEAESTGRESIADIRERRPRP